MNSLIDLTFLLLVVFIVTLPALEQSIPIILPKAQSKSQAREPNVMSITINAENQIFVDDKPVTLAEIEEKVKTLVAKDPDVGVCFRGDERITYGRAMEVVGLLQKYKVHRLSMATSDK